jgi:hypothetical protein
MRGIAIILTILVTSVSVAVGALEQGSIPTSGAVVGVLFVVFEFSGIAIVSAVGLLMLRAAWRRAHAESRGVLGVPC